MKKVRKKIRGSSTNQTCFKHSLFNSWQEKVAQPRINKLPSLVNRIHITFTFAFVPGRFLRTIGSATVAIFVTHSVITVVTCCQESILHLVPVWIIQTHGSSIQQLEYSIRLLYVEFWFVYLVTVRKQFAFSSMSAEKGAWSNHRYSSPSNPSLCTRLCSLVSRHSASSLHVG